MWQPVCVCGHWKRSYPLYTLVPAPDRRDSRKHDAFVEHDGNGGMIEEFSGKLLAQQEPDASSFPNGGLRNTFEARGYSAWNPPPRIYCRRHPLYPDSLHRLYRRGSRLQNTADTFCRSTEQSSERGLQLFQRRCSQSNHIPGLGTGIFPGGRGALLRPSGLSLTERTLLGHESAKNQQLDDHYFGAIPSRYRSS